MDTDRSNDPEGWGLEAALRAGYGPRARPATDSVLTSLDHLLGSSPRVLLREEKAPAGSPVRSQGADHGFSLPPGRGHYHLLGEMARGGMGVILKGHDTDLGRDVALKVMHRELCDRPESVERFVEEAQIGGQLQHPGIVPVYEMGLMSDERPYFTMKLVKGQTLANLLSEREPLPADRRRLLTIFEQVCQTVAYAHSRGVIHRDLKPSNVMVGAFGEVQVVDWGLAKVIAAGGTEDEKRTEHGHAEVTVLETVRSGDGSSHSRAGSVMGTPAYMSPEQARGEVEHLDERADVFGLGAILCELLTGKPPYVGNREATLRMAADAQLAEALSRLDACTAEAELVTLAGGCLAPAPSARPRNAEAVARAVHEHLTAVEERTHKAEIAAAEAGAKATAERRTRKRTLTLAAAVLVALVLGLIGTTTQASRAEAASRKADDQRLEAEHEAATKTAVLALLHDMLTGFEAAEKEMTVADMLDESSARIAGALPEDPLVEAEVRDMIRFMYERLGHNERAEPHARRVLEIRKSALEPDDDQTLDALHALAWILQLQGNPEEGQPMLDRILVVRRATLGEEHDLTLEARNNLGMNYWAQGRLQEAEVLLREVIETRRREYGDDHPDLASSINNLGLILMDQNHLQEAIELYRDSVRRTAAEKPTADHLLTLWNLGSALEQAGELDEALQVKSEVLAGRRAVLGDDHPETLEQLYDLIYAHENRGEYRIAVEMYGELLPAQRARYGGDHADVAEILHHYALALHALGDPERAESPAREALEMYHRLPSSPQEHHRHATMVLFDILLKTGTAEERIAMLREALVNQRAVMESGDGELYPAVKSLGTELLGQAEYEEAEPLLREALSIAQSVWPPSSTSHWLVLDTKSLLGEAVAGLRRFDEAEVMLVDAYEGMVSQKNAAREVAEAGRAARLLRFAEAKVAAGQRVVQLYEAWGRPEVAEEMRIMISQTPPTADR